MIYQWHLVKNVKSVETFSEIRWIKENDLFPPNHRETVIRTVILVIIVQPWSIIIIMEAFSYSIVINCCCLWLNCLLDLTLKSHFLLCSYIRSMNLPSIRACLCFTLRDCAPCWSSFTLWTASNLSVGLSCCSSKVTSRLREAPATLCAADGQQMLLVFS